nr:trans-resveratrol di-O-methyltransferase-like isoform X2 [Nicotiana tomentosiformis]
MSMNEIGSIDLLQAQTQTWNHMFNFISSSAAKCAVQLGIPDVLYKHGKPMSLSDLTAELSLIDHSKVSFLPILMRFLVHSGFLNQHEKEHYSLTPATQLLVKDDPLSMRSYFLIIHDPVLLKPWSCLSDWFQDDSSTAFHTAHEISLWDYYVQEPRVGDSFNEAMASDSRLISNVLITECKHVFEGLTSLVDVGGGTGTVAIGNFKGSGNVEFVGGSMRRFLMLMQSYSSEFCITGATKTV